MIIIIDNYDPYTNRLYQNIAGKADTRVFHNDKISVAEIEQMNPTGIILSPGLGRASKAGICIELIQKLGNKIPILGIGLGYQAIVEAFDGKVIETPENKQQKKIAHLENELFDSIANIFQSDTYASTAIELKSLPAELIVTAICEKQGVMAVQHVDKPCFGMQINPLSEFTPQGDRILNNFINICRAQGNHHASSTHQQAFAA